MEALIEYAHALGRAHNGDLDGARKAISRMKELRDATKEAKFDYFKQHLELQTQAASAWIANAEGNTAQALQMLRRAADAEDILGKHPVSPGALVPIREQLGSLLLELKQSKEAGQEFQAELKIYPGRFRGLYGAALAAEQSGDKQTAERLYAQVATQTEKADVSREEIKRIREYSHKVTSAR
jgi:tetratricopeptide (TPR) repeat protein